MSYTAGDVMNLSAALLNDRLKSLFSFEIQLPYLRSANDDLDLEIQDAGWSIVDSVCNVPVAIGATTVTLPCAFFLPTFLEQRIATSTDDDAFSTIMERNIEPSYEATQDIAYWAFRNNLINITPSTEAKTVRVTFRRNIIDLGDQTTVAEINKAKNFLAFRTAALIAEFVGNNKEIADSLNLQAVVSLEKLTSVMVKNTQGFRARRKPFRIQRSSLTIGR